MTPAVPTQGARVPGALFLLLLLLSGCASLPPFERTDAVVLADVPFYPQREFQCGPAALAMALNASGLETSADDLVEQVYVPAREGSLQPEMLASARRQGRIAYVIDGTVDGLAAELDQGHPIIVLQNLSLPQWPLWHYAVVIGVDPASNRMVLHTGEREAARVGIRRFRHTWARSDNWAMVALAPGSLPAAISPLAAAEAISAFERTAAPGVTISTWVAYTERWPRRALGWFGLGNARYGAENRVGAAQAFLAATEQDPGYGPAWVNLGFVREELGDTEGARSAFTRAAELEGPWRDAVQSALQRLASGQPPS